MSSVQGINHVALDVPDIEEAVDFYTHVFDVEVMRREGRNAWLDFGGRFDFLALFEDTDVDRQPKDGHWGCVVEDDELMELRERASDWDVEFYEKWDCSFWDPFGYRVEVIRQSDVSKAPTPYDPEVADFSGDV
jgi:catechol 2,3-dioxygenase-like lactoylglutathione lyase family enzyme